MDEKDTSTISTFQLRKGSATPILRMLQGIPRKKNISLVLWDEEEHSVSTFDSLIKKD